MGRPARRSGVASCSPLLAYLSRVEPSDLEKREFPEESQRRGCAVTRFLAVASVAQTEESPGLDYIARRDFDLLVCRQRDDVTPNGRVPGRFCPSRTIQLSPRVQPDDCHQSP